MRLFDRILDLFKLESTREIEQNTIHQESGNYIELDIGAAEAILNHVKVLADTINNTLDEKEFEQALIDIKSRLQLLSQYEKYNIFVGCTPSEDLRAINENEYLTRKKFRTRVYEARLSGLLPNKPQKKQKKTKKKEIYTRIEKPKRSMSPYDLERFAIMCNAGMEREDEMKQYQMSEECEEKEWNTEKNSANTAEKE